MPAIPTFSASRSIRTQFGLVSATILLALLFVFYSGGRYILVRMIREAEREIQSIGADVKTLIFGELQEFQRDVQGMATRLAETGGEASYAYLQERLDPYAAVRPVHLAAVLGVDGTFQRGCLLAPGAPIRALEGAPFADYFSPASPLILPLAEGRTAAGLVVLDGRPMFIALAPVRQDDGTALGLLVIGSLFHSSPLLNRIHDATRGMQVAVAGRPVGEARPEPGEARPAGIAPAVDTLMSFHSGGAWHVGENAFEAVLPVKDVLGREVTTISVRLPQSFASLASVALAWLTAFVATVGIIFILPIFWLQARMILNPLDALAQQIRDVGQLNKRGDSRYLQWTNRDEFGLVAQSVNGLLDALEQKSHQIEQIEQRQRALIAGMPDALCVFDCNGHLVAIHKQPDYAHPIPGLIAGKALSPPLFPQSDCDALRKGIEETFRSETIQMVIISCRESDGAYRHFETRISRMDPFFALVILRDVTQEWRERETRQQMESRLAKIEKMESLGNLAAGIAHDFNNVLTIIQNTLDTTWVETGGNDDEQIAIGTIREATSKGAALTRELMTYAGHTRIAFKRGDPNTLILDLEKLMGRVIAANVALELKLTPGLPQVDADPHQFWKVIINVLKNASEAMNGARGSICLSTYPYELTEADTEVFFSTHDLQPGLGVVFQIDDTGMGIPREFIDRLFEPFFSTKAVGRGLGLATVFGIVDAHNGGIDIQSEPGSGSSFRIWLPVAKDLDAPEADAADEPPPFATPEPQPANRAAEPAGPRPCVLVVEDDPAILQTTGILLRSLGADPLLAATKREALALFRKHADSVQLILLDAQIGSLDNVRLLATLRTRKPGVPTVIVSGHTEDRIRELFASEPFNGFLCKPYTMGELKALLAPFMAPPSPPAAPPAGDEPRSLA